MNSTELYLELLDSIDKPDSTELFENQLRFDEINKIFFEDIYCKKRTGPGKRRKAESKDEIGQQINQLRPLCDKCWSFFFRPVQNRKYDKQEDIHNANFFENKIMNFLKKKAFNVIRGDDENLGHHKGYPDLLVLGKNNDPICYLEIKYNAAPFLKVSKYVKGRECYEGSLTLNPKKLKRQVGMLGTQIKIPVYYVYWADFPCLKGIFFTEIQNIWNYFEEIGSGDQHDRRAGEGDFSYGRKIGQTQIIYPPIMEMKNFEELIDKLNELCV